MTVKHFFRLSAVILTISALMSFSRQSQAQLKAGVVYCPNFKVALDIAQSSHRDIAVLLYGSDWCVSGEHIRKNVWNNAAFASALGSDFVLTGIDYPDNPPQEPAYKALQKANSAFKCSTKNYPAIFVLDSKGRICGKREGLPINITMADMVKIIKGFRAIRVKRDNFWRQAEVAKGLTRARLLGGGLDVMRLGLGCKNVYKPILEEIKKADPEDKSFYARKYQFNAGAYDRKVMQLVNEKKYTEAVAYIDEQINSPGNRLLTKQQIQQLYMSKFHIYQKWPGHKKELMQVLLEVVKIAPDSNLGIGCAGYYLYHCGQPTLRYGWRREHCKTASTTWTLGNRLDDISTKFTTSGKYQVLLKYRRGRNSLAIDSVALWSGSRLLVRDSHSATISAANKTATYQLNIPLFNSHQQLALKIVCKTLKGTDSSGSIIVTRQNNSNANGNSADSGKGIAQNFLSGNRLNNRFNNGVDSNLLAGKTFGKFGGDTNNTNRFGGKADDVVSYIKSRRVADLFYILRQQLMQQGQSGSNRMIFGSSYSMFNRVVQDKKYVKKLMQYEVLRQVGLGKLTAMANNAVYNTFLQQFFTDNEWLDMFLNSGPFVKRSRPVEPADVLETLGILWQYDPAIARDHLRKVLATAIAIETASFNNPEISLERYRYYMESYSLGRLHPMFTKLRCWEMRFVVDTGGKDDGSLRYMRDNYNLPAKGYYGICWVCPYRGFNTFGDTIQGPLYYMPWQGRMPHWECVDINGGVCGSLSTFGSVNAQAHGVPAMAMGEPGHCAYTVRISAGNWKPCYDLSGNRTPKHYFYRSSWMHLLLLEDMYDHYQQLQKANTFRWLADLYKPLCVFQPGINYAVYKGKWKKLPRFDALRPCATGKCSDFDYKKLVGQTSDFGLVYTGTVMVDKSAAYLFSTTSDDGSRLFIDGQLVVNNDGLHRARKVSGKINLRSGRHSFRLEFFNNGPACSLQVKQQPLVVSSQSLAAYRLALKAMPEHYGIWRDYIDTLLDDPSFTKSKWWLVTRNIISGLADYPEPAWNLITRYDRKIILPAVKAASMVSFYDIFNRAIAKKKPDAWWNFASALNYQAGSVGRDASAKRKFLSHIISDFAYSEYYLPMVLDWGQKFTAHDEGLARAYCAYLRSLLNRRISRLFTAQMWRVVCKNAILIASRSEDFRQFHTLCRMANSTLDLANPKERYLNSRQLKSYPVIEPLPGMLLSAGGVLKTSSSSKYDKPWLYEGVLLPQGGYFHTNKEKNPWAIVVLPQKSDISGIIIVNRWENKNYRQSAVPLEVAVSADGKKWSQIFTSDKPDSIWRIDLTGKKISAKYIKVSTKHDKAQYFHLRNILVYGR